MDKERAGGKILRLFLYPKMEGQDCLQGAPQTYATTLSAGRKAVLHNLPRGCSPALTAFCPLMGLSELPDQREQQEGCHVGDDHAGSRGDGQGEGCA